MLGLDVPELGFVKNAMGFNLDDSIYMSCIDGPWNFEYGMDKGGYCGDGLTGARSTENLAANVVVSVISLPHAHGWVVLPSTEIWPSATKGIPIFPLVPTVMPITLVCSKVLVVVLVSVMVISAIWFRSVLFVKV